MASVNPFLAAVALGLVPQVTYQREQGPAIILQSEDPVYKLTLPVGYDYSVPREIPPRYVRSSGREAWARLSIHVIPMLSGLPQNPNGITAEEILALASPPPNSTTTFSRTPWKNLEVGVIEYRAVVKDLPVIGLTTILPLKKKGLRITVYAPDPLEKEVREDFQMLLASLAGAETNWYSDDALRKISLSTSIARTGGVLALLYPIAWAIFFRGRPMAGHWLRTAWLFLIALLLFVPITAPGPVTVANNLLVNALIPLLYVMMTVRRLKLGIDLD